jgi:hypothetical protein
MLNYIQCRTAKSAVRMSTLGHEQPPSVTGWRGGYAPDNGTAVSVQPVRCKTVLTTGVSFGSSMSLRA